MPKKKISSALQSLNSVNINDTVLFERISSIIETSRQTVYTAVNTEIVLMYWHIGEAIKKDILGNEKANMARRCLRNWGNL